MLTFGVIACLGVLLWIAILLVGIFSAINQLRWNSVHPDIKYPAFSRHEIKCAYDELGRTLKESLVAEERLFSAPGWEDITSGYRSPDEQEKHLMYESAFTTRMWEVTLSRCHFLTEANLRVHRGEWTIAQAHYYYQDLEPLASGIVTEAHKSLDAWCSRFKRKDSDEGLREYKEKMHPYETARENFLREWKERFKLMHDSKPIYH